jgi:hypothetical protein
MLADVKADSHFSVIPIVLGLILALLVVFAAFSVDGLRGAILVLLASWALGIAIELRWIDRHDPTG